MDDPYAAGENQWPDFIPPDFERSIPAGPHEPAALRPDPTFSGPVLPPAGRPAPRRRPAGSSDRWFSRPSSARSDSASLWRPAGRAVVTSALIAICLVVWVLQNLSYPFNDLVMLVPSLGASEPWRFLTSAFSHMPRSLTHIGFNMLTLWLIGSFLEPILGRARFLAVYLISALGGGVLFVVLAFPRGQGPGWLQTSWNSGVLGASGAVFGLFGAYMVIAWLQRIPLTSVWILLGLNVVVTVLFPGIAWQAHLGGFLAGAAATGAATWGLTRRHPGGSSATTWLGMALVLAALVAMVALKYAWTL